MTIVRTLKDAIIDGIATKAVSDWIAAKRKDLKFMNFLAGHKTYIVGGITLVLIVLHLFGWSIPGVDYTALGSIGTAIAVLFGRAGATTDAAKALVASSKSPVQTSVAEAKATVSATK